MSYARPAATPAGSAANKPGDVRTEPREVADVEREQPGDAVGGAHGGEAGVVHLFAEDAGGGHERLPHGEHRERVGEHAERGLGPRGREVRLRPG